MNALAALARLRTLGVPVVQTADASAVLEEGADAARKTLGRLATAGHVERVRSGTWWLHPPVDRLRLASLLTGPLDSYLSLHTALHLHGLIEQIPIVVYAVTQARTERIATTVGDYSFHHVAAELFGGFEEAQGGAWLATPEKALFDTAWLSAGRSRLFASLPEVELPRGFRRSELQRWVAKVEDPRRRVMVTRRLEAIVGCAGSR